MFVGSILDLETSCYSLEIGCSLKPKSLAICGRKMSVSECVLGKQLRL